MISKITRTILGLPIILFLWPFVFLVSVIVVIGIHFLSAVVWVFTGKFDYVLYNEHRYSRRLFIDSLTFSYRFLKGVWK